MHKQMREQKTIVVNDREKVIHLYLGNSQKSTFANSEDPNEMQHNAAFHQGLQFCSDPV